MKLIFSSPQAILIRESSTFGKKGFGNFFSMVVKIFSIFGRVILTHQNKIFKVFSRFPLAIWIRGSSTFWQKMFVHFFLIGLKIFLISCFLRNKYIKNFGKVILAHQTIYLSQFSSFMTKFKKYKAMKFYWFINNNPPGCNKLHRKYSILFL